MVGLLQLRIVGRVAGAGSHLAAVVVVVSSTWNAGRLLDGFLRPQASADRRRRRALDAPDSVAVPTGVSIPRPTAGLHRARTVSWGHRWRGRPRQGDGPTRVSV